MQRIERYGVLALVFLLVTLVTFALWDGDTKPGEDKVAKAGPVKEAPVRQLTPAERQQREALRRREEANRELELRRAQDTAKSNSLKEKYATGKSAADLSREAQANRAAASGFVRSDKPVVDGPPAGPERLQIGLEPVADSSRDTRGRRPNAPADLSGSDAADATRRAKEDEAEARRRALTQMDQQRRQREHVVARGETLSQIAMEQLGTSRRWQEIVALNPGLDPNSLRVGQKLKLPGAGASTPTVAPAPAPVATNDGPGGSYTIRSGDVLSRIAQDQLGSVKHVGAILALNPGLDPTRLSVGQVIAMPAGVVDPQRTAVASAPRSATASRPSASDRPRVR